MCNLAEKSVQRLKVIIFVATKELKHEKRCDAGKRREIIELHDSHSSYLMIIVCLFVCLLFCGTAYVLRISHVLRSTFFFVLSHQIKHAYVCLSLFLSHKRLQPAACRHHVPHSNCRANHSIHKYMYKCTSAHVHMYLHSDGAEKQHEAHAKLLHDENRVSRHERR